MGVTVSSCVRVEVTDSVAAIIIDRPPVNALSADAQDALHRAAEAVACDDHVRAVVLQGANRILSAGADIREMALMSRQDMAVQASRLQAAFRAVAQIPQPVVAAVEGYALGGGCELALAADHRIMATTAKIGLPEIRLGVIPAAGGTQRLTRLVGPSIAKSMIFTGQELTALQALEIGLVDDVVDPRKVLSTARVWASQFTKGPALALAAAKRAINYGAQLSLDAGLRLETDLFVGLFGTDDRHIGMQAFLKDGPGEARFQGR